MARKRSWLVWLRRLLLWPLVALACAIFLLLAWFVSAGVWLYGDMDSYTSKRHGELVRVELERTEAGATHTTAYHTLESSSGMEVRLALRRPVETPEGGLPLVVLLAGFKHGRTAIDRMGDTGNTVLAVVSYPFEGERWIRGSQWISASRRLRRTMHDTPAALMLVMDFMLQQPGVDPARTELIGLSLGAPLVCVTGALDIRFARVWSLQGGAGFHAVLETLMARRIRSAVLREPLVALMALLCHRLDPVDYVGRIAPRELIVVNGEQDIVFEREAAELLYARAGEPKEQIWMDSGHLNPREPEMIRELMSLVLSRIDPAVSPGDV